MFRYMVHVSRKNVMQWAYMAVRIEHLVQAPANLDKRCEWSDFEGMETYYFTQESAAIAFAQEVARQLPGREVLVLKSIAVVQTPAGEPVISNVTDKGVVPR